MASALGVCDLIGRNQKHRFGWNHPALPFDEVPSSKGDLRIFLRYLAALEKKIEEEKQYNYLTEESEEVLKKFIQFLRDPLEVIITGSSVLGFSIDKGDIAGDIDLFTRNETFPILCGRIAGDQAAKAVMLFAMKDFIFTNLDFLERINDLEKELHEKIALEDVFGQLSNSVKYFLHKIFFDGTSGEYDFEIMKYNLDTYRLKLLDLFDLNIIQVKYSDYRRAFRSYKNILNVFSPEEADDLNYPHIEHVVRSFDFEELKRYYSFEKKEVRSVYELAFEILENKNIKLDYFVGNRERREVEIRKTVAMGLMEKYSQVYWSKYNDPEVVTLSDKFVETTTPFIDSILNAVEYKEEPAKHIENIFTSITANPYLRNTPIQSMLMETIARVQKYTEKGFKVNDPHSLILMLDFTNQIISLVTLHQVEVERIERQSLLDTSTHTNPKIKEIFASLHKLRKNQSGEFKNDFFRIISTNETDEFGKLVANF